MRVVHYQNFPTGLVHLILPYSILTPNEKLTGLAAPELLSRWFPIRGVKCQNSV